MPRCVPENETRQLLYTGYMHTGPAAVRYPRGTGPGATIEKAMTALPIGKGVIRRDGDGVAILNFGTLLQTGLRVGDQLNATVADMRWVCARAHVWVGVYVHARARVRARVRVSF